MAAVEQELGSTDDPRALVLGEPEALYGTVARLRVLSDAFGRTAAGLARTDVGNWSGAAAEAFRSRFRGAPGQWSTAAGAFSRAAAAWENYARAVMWAQGRAAEAVARNRSAPAAPARPDAARGADPGVVDVAREILADARRQRDARGADAALALVAAAALAPDPPSGWDRFAAEATDSIDALGTEGAHLLGGLAQGTATVVGLAAALNPVAPDSLAQPARYLDTLSSATAGLMTAAIHPVRMVTGIAGTGWGSDPAEATGRLVPQVLAAAAGGAGRSAAPAVPRGFAGVEDFGRFGARLHDGLARAGYADTKAALQGSAVTGRSYRTGGAFDAGRTSDYDVALAGGALFDAAVDAGVALRSAGTRTGPLSAADVDGLGLAAVQRELTELAGRDVSFMIYREYGDALGRGPSMGVPGS